MHGHSICDIYDITNIVALAEQFVRSLGLHKALLARWHTSCSFSHLCAYCCGFSGRIAPSTAMSRSARFLVCDGATRLPEQHLAW